MGGREVKNSKPLAGVSTVVESGCGCSLFSGASTLGSAFDTFSLVESGSA